MDRSRAFKRCAACKEQAKSEQQLNLKIVDAKMSQWSREAQRPVKAKRPDAYVQLQRCSKIEGMLHSAEKKVYVAKVVAGLAGLAARDAEIAARDVRICQLLARVRQLKKMRPSVVRCSG